MKQWIIAICLILVGALGALAPAAAQASTVAATKLTSGKPVKTTISKHGQTVGYTFTAEKNKNVTFQVTRFNFSDQGSGGYVYLYFYEPGSSNSYTNCGFSGNNYCNFTTPVGGTWKVKAVPYSDSVGSLTLTFANNVGTVKLSSGKSVTTTIKFEGQEAGYTFVAQKNKNVTFQLTRFNFSDNGSDGYVYLYFYEPGSSSAYTNCGFSANNYCNFTPPEGGTWSVALVPYSASTGSLNLTFANNVPTVKLTSGKAVTTTIKFEGQEAGYTFAARKNEKLTLHVSKFHFTDSGSDGYVYLYFYEPGSSSAYTNCGFSASGTCSFKAPVGGTWTAMLVPYSASVGNLELKLN
jgi:hypothetical protein